MNRYQIGLDGYTIRQMQNQDISQMMGYVIGCPDGSAVVIDGGTQAATARLRQLLWDTGGRVSLWLFTHFHYDHLTAPLNILERPNGLQIDRVCACPVSAALHQPNFESSDPIAARFTQFMERETEKPDWVRAEKGLRLEASGLQIECLNDPMRIVREPELDLPGYHVNDSSAVYHICFPNGRTALFPGDVGPGVSRKLAEELGNRLQADICQMSHHGQHGAEFCFYECVRPSFCFWDAPDWLWENDPGTGFNTGMWKTVEVRGWMAKLGVFRHAVQADGENLLY